jgi:hypothetical protein
MPEKDRRAFLDSIRRDLKEQERQAWRGFFVGAVIAAALFLLSIPFMVRM